MNEEGEEEREGEEEEGEGGKGRRRRGYQEHPFFQKRRMPSDSLLHRAQLNTHNQLSL